MKNGGKRIGAGNKLGNVRPKLTDYWTQDDIADYFTWLKRSYKKNPTMAKLVGEQLMGKPVQPITNPEGETFKISGVNINVRD